MFRSTEFKGTRPVTGDESIKSHDRANRLRIPNIPSGVELEELEVAKNRYNTAQGKRPRADYHFVSKTVKGVSKLRLPRGSGDFFDSK